MAERLSRREFLSATSAIAGSVLVNADVTQVEDQIDRQLTSRADSMPEELKNIEFWRAADTSDYKSIEINSYPAIIIVESGPYEGMRLHTQSGS